MAGRTDHDHCDLGPVGLVRWFGKFTRSRIVVKDQELLGPSQVCGPARTLGIVALSVLTLEGLSNPGGILSLGWGIFPLSPILPALVLLGWLFIVGGLARTSWRVFAKLKLGRDRASTTDPRFIGRMSWHTFAVAVCIVAVISAFVGRWPLQARFRLSRPAFDQEVARLLSSPALSPQQQFALGDRWLGLYYVFRIQVHPDRILFTTGGIGFGSFGFAYKRSSATQPSDGGLGDPAWGVWTDTSK